MKLLQTLLWQLEKLLSGSSLVPEQPFLDPATFSWTPAGQVTASYPDGTRDSFAL